MGIEIENKVVLVTGANRGIGKIILETALAQGAKKVYAGVRQLGSADPLVEQHGDRVVPVHIDLEDPSSITAAAQAAQDADVVINNAGVLRSVTPLASEAVEAFEFEINVNVSGLMRMAQAFAPVLKSNGGGALVQLNSVVSVKAFSDFATYSASKAASYSITQSLRDLLAPQNTQVVSVHPGPIATDMAHGAGLGEMAEPPTLVADAIFNALRQGDFHVFPDTMAKQIGGEYQSFAKNIVERNIMEDNVTEA